MVENIAETIENMCSTLARGEEGEGPAVLAERAIQEAYFYGYLNAIFSILTTEQVTALENILSRNENPPNYDIIYDVYRCMKNNQLESLKTTFKWQTKFGIL